MKTGLSLVVITKDEEELISSCLASASFASQRLVVDSGSQDRTTEISRSMGAKVIVRGWTNYSDQKQYAIDQAENDWILSLDADEVLEPSAKEEILNQVEGSPSAYRIPRFHFFCGRVLKHGKGIDFPIRLFRKSSSHFSGREIHEEIITTDPVKKLNHGMIHYSSPTLLKRIKKMRRDILAELKYRRRPSIYVMLVTPFRYCFSYLIFKHGYRDGWQGVVWTTSFAIQIFFQEAAFLIKWVIGK